LNVLCRRVNVEGFSGEQMAMRWKELGRHKKLFSSIHFYDYCLPVKKRGRTSLSI